MDRFLSRWKAHSNDAAATMGRVSPGLALQQTADDEEDLSDSGMSDFIEDDLDEDDEHEERKGTQLQRVQATGQVHKRVKLQMQLAGGSAAAARTMYKPEAPAKSTISAAASASASNRAASSSAAPLAASASSPSSSQPTLSRAQQNAQKLFQRRQPTNARPPAAAAASSAAASSVARPAAAASAMSSSQPGRAAASTAASSAAAAPSLARAVSAPEPATTQPEPAAAAIAAAPRKRKHLAADDASPTSNRSLVELIEDWSDDEDVSRQPRRSQIQQLLLRPVPKPTPPPPPPPRHRSVLSMMHAVQSGTIPFASQQFARIARRREARTEMREEVARKALERGEDMEDQAVSMVSVGPFSSASSIMAAASSSSAAAAAASAAAASSAKVVAAPCGSSMPHYASSAFRTSQVRHTELFHHSMKHLLWSRLSTVRDWSLSGEKAAASAGVPFDRFAPPPPPSALSYVTQLRFDHQGALLCASSNNGLVDLYDFDDVWMSGRRVEKSKRSRELRAREEYRRVASLIRGRADSPPRSPQKWKLNQPAPVLKPYASPSPPAHERIRPIFSMNLAASADVAEVSASQRASPQQAPILRQIDTQHWSSSNHNEIALSSQRSNHIYLFDVSRCDEQGSPHRRILLGDAFTPAHASCVMDFVYFPAAARSNGGSNGSGKTLVAALRNGEINTLDLRVSNGVASADATKVFKAQQRATSSNSVGLNNRPNPPASLQISGCGQKLYVFTEQGTLESWDTRLMRASFERVHLLESMWNDSHKGTSDAGTLGMHQPVLGRVCSSSIHPQDDHALLFQLLSGAVGLVDLNPCSPSFQSVRTVVPHSAAFVSSALDDQFSLRPKHTAVFLHNGQSGSNASAKRERIIAAADLESQMRIIESCSASACRSPPSDPRVRASSSDSMLDRELQRSSDVSSRSFAAALSPSMHLLHTLPPPIDDSLAARYSSLPLANPIMSLAAHPHAPFLLLGCKHQRIRLVSHESELEDKMEAMEIVAEAST